VEAQLMLSLFLSLSLSSLNWISGDCRRRTWAFSITTASANGFYYYLHTCCSRGIVLNKNSNFHTCVFHVPFRRYPCRVLVLRPRCPRRRLWHRLPDKLTKRQNRCRHFLLGQNTHNSSNNNFSQLMLSLSTSLSLSCTLSLFSLSSLSAQRVLYSEAKAKFGLMMRLPKNVG